MTITSRDGVMAGLAADSADRFIINKTYPANQIVGRHCSLWRAVGQPGAGAIPGAAALCTSSLTGAIQFNNFVAPTYNYLAYVSLVNPTATQTCEIWDRLVHMGGLSFAVTTAQTANVDASTLAVPADRRGGSNYSDMFWYLEVYSDGGATASNATISVTYNDGTTGTLNTVAVGGTVRAGMMIPLTPLIPSGSQGKFIRGVTSVTLSASTGTAGSFGFTAMRPRGNFPMGLANTGYVYDWELTGLPDIPNDSCLMLTMFSVVSSPTGILKGTGKIIHG